MHGPQSAEHAYGGIIIIEICTDLRECGEDGAEELVRVLLHVAAAALLRELGVELAQDRHELEGRHGFGRPASRITRWTGQRITARSSDSSAILTVYKLVIRCSVPHSMLLPRSPPYLSSRLYVSRSAVVKSWA